MVRGNFARAAGSLDAISSGQATPPDLGFVKTPRTGVGLTHRVVLLLSADDVTAHEFADHASSDSHWRGALGMPQVRRVDVAGADHTFSNPETGPRVLALTLEWLRGLGGAATR